MSTRGFIYLTRLIKAVFILALCGLLAVGVYADGDSHKQRVRGRDSVKQDGGARDAKDQQSDSSNGTPSKQPADPKSRDQARSNRDDSRAKPGSDDHKTPPAPTGNDNRRGQRPDTNSYHPGDSRSNHDDGSKTPSNTGSKPPANDSRPSQRPDTNGYHPGDSRNNHDDGSKNPANNDSRPSANNWDNRDRNIPHDYTPDRNRDRDDNRSRSYQPPSHNESNHYYPSHPKPYHYGHWVFDSRNSDVCRRSVYFHYGYFPYLQVTRIHTLPYIVIGYRSTHVVLGGGYYLSKETSDLDRALADIRDAWTDGRYDLIDRHLDSNEEIAVLLDGRYDYSIDAGDYADMTSDAIDEVGTVSFTWESIRQRTNDDYTAFAKHIFRDSRGDMQTVYVSYTLQRMGQDYVIVEVGSSNSPLM